MFRKYDHVERLGHPDVEGIDIGTVYVFPKLDGTNASVWLDVCPDDPDLTGLNAGSRRREISPVDDNAGFAKWASSEPKFLDVLADRPDWILYGEWLVPHTLRTYRDEAWRRFWVFDVYDCTTGSYVPFDEYMPVLEEAGIDVIQPLVIATNPTQEQLAGWVESNTYLVKDGEGAGEGIVLKNYEWTNQYGRQPWAKVVRNEFKERHKKAMGVPEPEGGFQVELAAAEMLLTEEMVQKTLAKIVLGMEDGNMTQAFIEQERRHIIPRLLETVYHDFVVEETWTILRKWKAHQTIDFKRLRAAVIARTKQLLPELF